MLVRTRFGNTNQLHRVASAGGARTQISFETEPVSGSLSPSGDVLLVSMDRGGSEFYQLHTLRNGRLTMLTDGKSRNEFGAWSKDGRLVGYASTRRNGADSDLYVIDPRNPKSDRLVAQVKGGGWGIAAFMPEWPQGVVANTQSITKSRTCTCSTCKRRNAPDRRSRREIAYYQSSSRPTARLWVLSDEGATSSASASLDIASGKFTAAKPALDWDIEEFAISDDGRSIAFLSNEAGASRLHFLDSGERRGPRASTAFRRESLGDLEFAPWGTLGLTLQSARIPGDAFAVDPASLAVTRWTASETGGLDPNRNAEPELVEVTSFDGEKMSGFLYRPDAAKFPGKRPLLMWIHGGPESQDRPPSAGATTI